MSRLAERIALAGGILALLGVLWQASARLAVLAERVETLRADAALLKEDLKAINSHFIAWAAQHQASERAAHEGR